MTIDCNSATWIALAKYLNDRIADMHRQLEVRGIAAYDADFLRGHIAACREVLALADGESADIAAAQPHNLT